MRTLAWLVLLPSVALATDDAVRRFESYVRVVGPLCATAPSTDCFDVAFTRADRDDDDHLALGELTGLRADLSAWLQVRGSDLPANERTYVRLGMWIVDTVGLAPLFTSFDADGDDRLSRAELQADIRLDDRRLAEVALDPDAVDWASVRGRLGVVAGAALPFTPGAAPVLPPAGGGAAGTPP